MGRILKSSKAQVIILGLVAVLGAKYLGIDPEVAKIMSVKIMAIVVALVGAIAWEDSRAKKAGTVMARRPFYFRLFFSSTFQAAVLGILGIIGLYMSKVPVDQVDSYTTQITAGVVTFLTAVAVEDGAAKTADGLRQSGSTT